MSFYSPDAPAADLSTWSPPTGEFGVLIQSFVGIEGDRGEESFEFRICTPGWLSHRLQQAPYVLGHHHIIVSSWDFTVIESLLREIVRQSSADDWDGVVRKLSRYGRWEFQDSDVDK